MNSIKNNITGNTKKILLMEKKINIRDVKNAVPPIISFQSKKNHLESDYIDECRHIKNVVAVKNTRRIDKHWEF